MNLPFLCSKTELARALGIDSRSVLSRLPKPVAVLVNGERITKLYPFPTAPINAAIAVNLGRPNPSEVAKQL
jgi:hypothetical protein